MKYRFKIKKIENDFKIEDKKVALETFIPSPIQTPGRMNLFEFNNFKVLLDYAHNPAGFKDPSTNLKTLGLGPGPGPLGPWAHSDTLPDFHNM